MTSQKYKYSFDHIVRIIVCDRMQFSKINKKHSSTISGSIKTVKTVFMPPLIAGDHFKIRFR